MSPMHVTLIGIGTGNPEHMTVQGIRALNACDLVLVPRKGAHLLMDKLYQAGARGILMTELAACRL